MLKKFKLNFNLFRFLTLCIVITAIAIGLNLFINYSYKSSMNSFYSSFNSKNYDDAYAVFNNKALNIPFKESTAKEDASVYFTKIVGKVCSNLKTKAISDNTAVEILVQIHKFQVLDDSLDKLILSLDNSAISSDNGFYALGIDYYNKKDYSNAYTYFNKIIDTNSDLYKQANEYKIKIQKDYKTSLLAQADELVANKYYTKAIDLLNMVDTTIINNDDADIQKKINFISTAKDEYLAYQGQEDTEYTSNMIMESLTQDNINTFNIESKTEYLLYVNLATQKTDIFQGSANNWNLIKSFSCSTGIAGEETPKGVYSIQTRGDWFFSDEYQQGGKYWVQFMGDYLFHSLPFNEDQSQIVDETLGTPASHGCIRLKVEESKWLYDNIPNDTKLIIN